MMAASFVRPDAHADTLMTPDVAVAGWRSLREPEQRWKWFQKLYDQAAHLDRRYRLALRIGWWEDEIQVELLATLGAWVACSITPTGSIPRPRPACCSNCNQFASLYAAARSNSIQNATVERSNVTYAPSGIVRPPTMFRDKPEHDAEREFSPPPALDGTIRVVICTSGSSDDIAGRVQRAIGEYSSPSDELHVSHAIAPDPRSGQTLYSALIVLRPGLGDG